MFVKAIEKVEKFTRPIFFINRVYGNTGIRSHCATCVVVNDEGWILTCRHVAELLQNGDNMSNKYKAFKIERSHLFQGDVNYAAQVKELEQRYGYDAGKNVLIQQKKRFVDIVDDNSAVHYFLHPKFDIALIHLEGLNHKCDQFPVFAKDSSMLKQGMSLCRYGYPFPEFNNYKYDETSDDIEWTNVGKTRTPSFPVDGMLTRVCADTSNHIVEVELSSPGLKGQSGGPLFDVNGIVYGIQSQTISLPLGFDQENREIDVNGVTKKVNDYSFIHLGRCVHIDIVKDFMDSHHVKYQKG